MKIILFCLLAINTIFAGEYYAKLEPIDSFSIKSSVSGKVIYTNEKVEGLKAKNSLIVEIDSKINQIELKQYRNKLKLVNDMITIENNNYSRLNKVSSKSAFEKDNQKVKVINLKSTRADLIIKIENLKDMIKNKKLIEKSNYIFTISVKKGDYVNPGTLLYEAKDLSKGKLEIYVPIKEAMMIKNKSIFIDGKASDIKINKIYTIADSQHISSYKVELLLDNAQTFSRLVKIEFK